jgi:hypothetical protein
MQINNAVMKFLLTIVFFNLLFGGYLLAQEKADSTAVAEKPESTDKPVRFSWESGYLIDQQTSKISPKNTFESVIQHKFGTIDNGRSDLWGIFAPGANVRVSFDYVIMKNIQIGYGITKNNMYSDFNAKWALLEQKTESMPISITLYGNVAIDGRSKSVFDTLYYNYSNPSAYYGYKFSNRLSYYSEAIVSRKMNDQLSLQAGINFSHYNTVEADMDHDRVGISFGGRYKVSPQGSVIFTYDLPLKISSISEGQAVQPQPAASLGYEVSTGSHAFQVYMGTSDALLPQDNMMNNQNKIAKKYFSVGFVITRLWGF